MKLLLPAIVFVALIAFVAGVSVKNSFISPFNAAFETKNQKASESTGMQTSQAAGSGLSGGAGAVNPRKTFSQNGNTYTSQNLEDKIVMNGTYKLSSYNVNFSFTLPKNGGDISGSLSGTCEGTITGNAAAPNQYNHSDFTGTYKGTCKPVPGLGFKTNASGEFNGTAWFGEGKAGVHIFNEAPRAYAHGFFLFKPSASPA